jgi:hypothetical protein
MAAFKAAMLMVGAFLVSRTSPISNIHVRKMNADAVTSRRVSNASQETY